MIQLPSGKSPDSLAEQGEMHKFTGGDAVLESQEEILLPQLPHTLIKITDTLPQLATGRPLLPCRRSPNSPAMTLACYALSPIVESVPGSPPVIPLLRLTPACVKPLAIG